MPRCLGFLLLCMLMLSISRQARDTNSGQDADIGGRLDKLELMLSQQREEFKKERMEWKTAEKALKAQMETMRENVAVFTTEKQTLKEDIKLLRQAQRNLAEENRDLKNDIKVLHEKLNFMVQDDVMQLSETVNDVHNSSAKNSEGHEQFESQTLKKSEELATRIRQPRPHNVSARSDDQGPLEAVIGQMTQQLTHVTADVQTLKNDNVRQDHDIQESRGSTFVRWGSSTCPPSTQLIYSGILGGSDTNVHTGSAPNRLCLTTDPVFTLSQTADVNHALVYGGEYQSPGVHYNQDPLCAVCRSPRPSSLMVPGTNVCPTGWTLEYAGYIMASRDNHVAGSEFVCVDPKMEARPGSDGSLPASELWYSATVCGSLPCPPYEGGKVVLCAVCTK